MGSIPVGPTSLRSERSEKRRLSRRIVEKPDQNPPQNQNRSPLRLGKPVKHQTMPFYYVYLLRSTEGNHTYIGFTQELKTRLQKHNQGEVHHTSKYRPWKIQTAISFDSREKAIAYERYIKSHSGREYSKRHF
tara:strand:+ start:226 stop:624 length:399 start_codon:yes stop_codon:yes gene_type:complete